MHAYIHTPIHTYIHTYIIHTSYIHPYLTLPYLTLHYITSLHYIALDYITLHACIHTYTHAYIHTYMHAYIPTYIHTYIHPYWLSCSIAFLLLLSSFLLSLPYSVEKQEPLINWNSLLPCLVQVYYCYSGACKGDTLCGPVFLPSLIRVL